VPANEASAKAQGNPELPTFGRERLSPGAYHVDLSAVETFVLRNNGQPSTFGDIYYKLRNAKILQVPERFGMYEQTYLTNSGEVTISSESGQSYVSGQSFVLNVLRDFIDLAKDGVDPERATWFYYGHDWSRDADELFLFFVVYDGKIVRDRLSFMHCDPRVLTKYQANDEPIWRAEPYEHAAWETYWYRKFYADTLTGQLLVLRPDEPLLYHYERALVHDVARDVEVVTLIKIYRFLWVAVPLLAAIAFPILKPYMAAIAIAAAVDLLWRCWATHKIGHRE